MKLSLVYFRKECGAKNNKVMVFGEIKPTPEDPVAFVDGIVKKVMKDVGYEFGGKGKRMHACLLQRKARLVDVVNYVHA